MSVFSLSVAAVKTRYDQYLGTLQTVIAVKALIAAEGDRPTFPTEVIANADWNNVVTAQNSWDLTHSNNISNLFAANKAMRFNELLIIEALGFNSGDTTGICLNQWVKVVGAGAGYLTYTNWLGAAFDSTYLTILDVEPTQPYPNF